MRPRTATTTDCGFRPMASDDIALIRSGSSDGGGEPALSRTDLLTCTVWELPIREERPYDIRVELKEGLIIVSWTARSGVAHSRSIALGSEHDPNNTDAFWLEREKVLKIQARWHGIKERPIPISKVSA